MKRWKTREVMVGKVGVGGENPIRIQSMTTSSTRDVEATIDQIVRLADAGCEIARITVQGMKEADACEGIKNGLLKRGYEIPLVADIHFYPPAAMRVADFVDKVRVNPGNFVDKRAIFKKIDYDDKIYAEEIEKIEEGFSPLVEKCKRLKRAMRIGTNHGSLSDRIMNRYGDTAFGMVESALEFARVCRKHDYHDIIFSMKASNPLVMIQAYQLLVAEMIKLGWDYPLHLGVTEAGQDEDGRVKSALGIGSLLLDGIGDTIRVSLTEDPWLEIDPCKRLISFSHAHEEKDAPAFTDVHMIDQNPRRKTNFMPPLHRDGTVILALSEKTLPRLTLSKKMPIPDAVLLDHMPQAPEAIRALERLKAVNVGVLLRSEVVIVSGETPEEWQKLLKNPPAFLFLSLKSKQRLHVARRFFDWAKKQGLESAVILHFSYGCSWEDLVIQSSAECGALLADKLGEGICLQAKEEPSSLCHLSFSILQAVRMRSSKTDFISCPGCGRTLFDLQSVTKRIRTRTEHLPGVKIAIMGCIVNGPGEMADADFGYVGSKAGKIDLYVGKTCVERNIDFADADERLVTLIKAHDRWIEPN